MYAAMIDSILLDLVIDRELSTSIPLPTDLLRSMYQLKLLTIAEWAQVNSMLGAETHEGYWAAVHTMYLLADLYLQDEGVI